MNPQDVREVIPLWMGIISSIGNLHEYVISGNAVEHIMRRTEGCTLTNEICEFSLPPFPIELSTIIGLRSANSGRFGGTGGGLERVRHWASSKTRLQVTLSPMRPRNSHSTTLQPEQRDRPRVIQGSPNYGAGFYQVPTHHISTGIPT